MANFRSFCLIVLAVLAPAVTRADDDEVKPVTGRFSGGKRYVTYFLELRADHQFLFSSVSDVMAGYTVQGYWGRRSNRITFIGGRTLPFKELIVAQINGKDVLWTSPEAYREWLRKPGELPFESVMQRYNGPWMTPGR